MGRISALTFASSNWTRSPVRFTSDFATIREKADFFGKTLVWNEANLDRAYHDRFSRYYGDAGFAYWSWKPYAVLQALRGIPEGDFLLYLDGGCRLPMDRIDSFLMELDDLRRNLEGSDCRLAITGYPFPNELIVRKEILNAFGLTDNTFFRRTYLHWQAGVFMVQNNAWTRGFMSRWYDFFDRNYETLIRTDFGDKTGQVDGFVHNGGDQAILQCMLFTEQVKPLLMNYLTDKYGFYCRDRG